MYWLKMSKKLDKIIEKIVPILKEWKVKRAGIFGSYARGDNKLGSDVDILVEIDQKISLSELMNLKILMEKSINKNIDIVEYSCLHPLMEKEILKEEVKVL